MPYDSRDNNAPRPRYRRPGYHTKSIQLDLSDGLLDPLHAIAQERGTNIFKLIREILYYGIRDYNADKRLKTDDADERKGYADFENEGEWQP